MNMKIATIMMMKATMMIKTKMMTISVMTMTKMMTLLISPGNLAHSIPPLPKHKIIFQRRKLVDVQHLKKESIMKHVQIIETVNDEIFSSTAEKES